MLGTLLALATARGEEDDVLEGGFTLPTLSIVSYCSGGRLFDETMPLPLILLSMTLYAGSMWFSEDLLLAVECLIVLSITSYAAGVFSLLGSVEGVWMRVW